MFKDEKRKKLIEHRELSELSNNQDFRKAILHQQKRLENWNFIDICERFNLTDLEWVAYLVKHWDSESPLPRPNDLAVEKSRTKIKKDSHKMHGMYTGNRFSTLYGFSGAEVETPEGSPRLWWQKIYQRDELGATWFTMRIRITPELTIKEMCECATEDLRKRRRSLNTSNKPSIEPLALSFLEGNPQNKKETIWKLSSSLMKEFDLERSAAKAYARKYKGTLKSNI